VSTGHLSASQPDPLHLALGEPLLGPVVKLGCAWALVRRHFLRVLPEAETREHRQKALLVELTGYSLGGLTTGSQHIAGHSACL
jgi:hypothetical protein